MNRYELIATLAFVLIFVGAGLCRRRWVHVPLVSLGIVIDLTMVVILEFQRDVIGQVIGETFHWMSLVHIGSSSLAVLAYLPTIWFGVAILRGGATKATWKRHKSVAIVALVLRTIGFAFMWTL